MYNEYRFVDRWFVRALRWEAKITEADAPHGFAFTMTGAFVGAGSWSFAPGEGGTNTVFDFRPGVEKAGVKQRAPCSGLCSAGTTAGR